MDHQIKIRGFRVELGEIEHVLREVAKTAQAVVIGWPKLDFGYGGVITYLVGYEIAREVLMAECRKRLPAYMVPSEFHWLEKLPLSPNGKIDRNAILRIKQES